MRVSASYSRYCLLALVGWLFAVDKDCVDKKAAANKPVIIIDVVSDISISLVAAMIAIIISVNTAKIGSEIEFIMKIYPQLLL